MQFLGVAQQIVDPGEIVSHGCVKHTVQLDKMHFEVTPFIGEHLIPVVYHKALPGRLPAPARQQGKLTDTVDHTVRRHVKPRHVCQRGHDIGDVHDGVGFLSLGNPAGPAHQKRRAQGTFQRGKIMAAPVARGTEPIRRLLGPIFAHPDDERILAQAQLVDGIEYLAGAIVEFRQHICPYPVAGAALEIRMCQCGEMHLGERQVNEERLVLLRLQPHEGYRPPGEFGIYCAPRDQVVCHDIDRRLTAPGLPNPGRADYLRVKTRLRGVFTFIGGIGYPVPLVETLVCGISAAHVAQVPLAVHRGGVAGAGEQFR